MINLTRNELKLLYSLFRGNTEVKAPSGMTDAQYLTAAYSLNKKEMVQLALVEGGNFESIRILTLGRCVIDDLETKRRHILWKILKEYDLTLDQYDLLVEARDLGFAKTRCYGVISRECELVLNPLLKKNYIYYDREASFGEQYEIDRLGVQLVNEIEEELFDSLPLECSVAFKKDEIFDCNDEDFDEESCDIQRGQGKRIRTHKVTAKFVVDCVMKSGLLLETTKTQWEKLLAEITGLSKATLHKHICGSND